MLSLSFQGTQITEALPLLTVTLMAITCKLRPIETSVREPATFVVETSSENVSEPVWFKNGTKVNLDGDKYETNRDKTKFYLTIKVT